MKSCSNSEKEAFQKESDEGNIVAMGRLQECWDVRQKDMLAQTCNNDVDLGKLGIEAAKGNIAAMSILDECRIHNLEGK